MDREASRRFSDLDLRVWFGKKQAPQSNAKLSSKGRHWDKNMEGLVSMFSGHISALVGVVLLSFLRGGSAHMQFQTYCSLCRCLSERNGTGTCSRLSQRDRKVIRQG